MVWYSHLFQNFLQFVVIYTVKGFGIVDEAEVDVFLELSCFFDDPTDFSPSFSVKLVMSGIRRTNYHTIALISYASKLMLKILQARLQQYVN